MHSFFSSHVKMKLYILSLQLTPFFFSWMYDRWFFDFRVFTYWAIGHEHERRLVFLPTHIKIVTFRLLRSAAIFLRRSFKFVCSESEIIHAFIGYRSHPSHSLFQNKSYNIDSKCAGLLKCAKGQLCDLITIRRS